MERLTIEGNFCEIARCGYPTCPYKDGCSQKQVWERLKQYEDSKLSPEDASNLHAILRLGDGMTLMRLRELAVADQGGARDRLAMQRNRQTIRCRDKTDRRVQRCRNVPDGR